MDNMVGFISSYGPLTTIENKMETCSDELKLARRKVAELTREVIFLKLISFRILILRCLYFR